MKTTRFLPSLNWTTFPCRWVWTPGFERWSTGRCRTRRLKRLRTPSYRSTRWCTGTPTHDSSPPTSTSRSFTAARAPPPNPSPAPPPLLVLRLRDRCQTIATLLSRSPPSTKLSKNDQTTPRLLSSLLRMPNLWLLPRLSSHFLFCPLRILNF